MKLGKNYEEIFKKLWNIGDASYKLFEKPFDGKFVKFSRQFLEELTKNCAETSDNFKEKLRWNHEKILKIFKTLESLSRGAS